MPRDTTQAAREPKLPQLKHSTRCGDFLSNSIGADGGQARRAIFRAFGDKEFFRAEPVYERRRMCGNQNLRLLRCLSQTIHQSVEQVGV